MARTNSISSPIARRTPSEIVALLAAQEQGPLTVKEFCKINHLSRGVFYQWRSRYGVQSITPAFIPLDLGAADNNGGVFAEIEFPGNRVVRLFRDVDPSYLKAVLAP